jgi:hypothetical protein
MTPVVHAAGVSFVRCFQFSIIYADTGRARRQVNRLPAQSFRVACSPAHGCTSVFMLR